MEKIRKKRNNYVDNKKFQAEMLKFREQLTKNPNVQANNYIGTTIKLIAEHYAANPKFYAYTPPWKEEMILDGIEMCVRYGLKNYDPTKFSNPLAYFTEIIHWSFVRRIKREKVEQYKKFKNQQNNSLLNQLSSNRYQSEDNDVVDQIIKDFETKLSTEKSKRVAKKKSEVFSENKLETLPEKKKKVSKKSLAIVSEKE